MIELTVNDDREYAACPKLQPSVAEISWAQNPLLCGQDAQQQTGEAF